MTGTLVVTRVLPGSPAEAQGVVDGCRVVRVGGLPVTDVPSLKAAFQRCRDTGDTTCVVEYVGVGAHERDAGSGEAHAATSPPLTQALASSYSTSSNPTVSVTSAVSPVDAPAVSARAQFVESLKSTGKLENPEPTAPSIGPERPAFSTDGASGTPVKSASKSRGLSISLAAAAFIGKSKKKPEKKAE